MKRNKIAMLATGALTAALVLGGIGYAYGETVEDTSTAGWLGGAMHRAGGGLVGIVADLTGLEVSDVAERRHDGESFADIAESEGVGVDDVKDAAVTEFEASLDERLTSTDAMERGRGGRGGMMGGPGGMSPESVLADLSGLDITEIRDLRADGQSLADIAAAQEVDIDEVIDTAIADAEEHLQSAVDEGRIDAGRMAEMLETMRTHLGEIVNSTDLPTMGGRGMGGGRMGGGGGFGNAPTSDSGDASMMSF